MGCHVLLHLELAVKTASTVKQILQNGMGYVIWAKGPVMGPVRSFNTDRRRREKKK